MKSSKNGKSIHAFRGRSLCLIRLSASRKSLQWPLLTWSSLSKNSSRAASRSAITAAAVQLCSSNNYTSSWWYYSLIANASPHHLLDAGAKQFSLSVNSVSTSIDKYRLSINFKLNFNLKLKMAVRGSLTSDLSRKNGYLAVCGADLNSGLTTNWKALGSVS